MRIPVTVHPFFWVFAALIGWLNSNGSWVVTLIWVGVIFISVLIHEWGHALTAVLFKQTASIELIAFGGLTTFHGPALPFWKQFLITFNGPFFGFGLYLIASVVLATMTLSPVLYDTFFILKFANPFWTVVNLLPVIPLDGGQLLRIVLEANFGLKGMRASLLLGAIFAALLSFYFFIMQNFLIGAFFFLFGFQSFDLWRKSRHMTRVDREEGIKELLMKGELALQQGKKEEAAATFAEVHRLGAKGVFATTAAQYLAFLWMKEGKHREAYEILLPLKEHLSDETLCLLHQLAAEVKNDPLVAELAAGCYQVAPTQEMALQSARSFARLGEAKNAGGWLQTAWKEGGLDLRTVLSEEAFSRVRRDPTFLAFVDLLKNE